MDFDQYLRANENNQHNTAVKYCLNLKRVMNTAVVKNYIPFNPLSNHKTVYKLTPQVYLEEYELRNIQEARLTKLNHKLVHDLFVFQCLTGLAYTDMMNLKSNDLIIDSQGRSWIIKPRQKTGVISTIPILPAAKEILNKYRSQEISSNNFFTGYAIQKYNQYLNEIGDLLGINKKLSSHVGRRSFGNIALGRGVSINVVSKILGHSSTRITETVYAVTTRDIISRELIKWG